MLELVYNNRLVVIRKSMCNIVNQVAVSLFK